MGDRSSTATTFVFLVTLIGVFAVLTGSMPIGFYEIAPDYRQPGGRNDWFPDEDIGFMNYTDSCNLTKGGAVENLEIGDIYVDVQWITVWGINFRHKWQVLWWWDSHLFDDMPITLSDLEANSPHNDHANESYMVLTCPCQKTYYTYFIYNSTTYGSWAEAWAGGDLDVYMGMGWDDAIEKMNAWSLIWSIMTFQSPQVFGAGVAADVMTKIIASTLWSAFAIIGAIMILWFIPLLGGE